MCVSILFYFLKFIHAFQIALRTIVVDDDFFFWFVCICIWLLFPRMNNMLLPLLLLVFLFLLWNWWFKVQWWTHIENIAHKKTYDRSKSYGQIFGLILFVFCLFWVWFPVFFSLLTLFGFKHRTHTNHISYEIWTDKE